jgi:nucleoside 2-deoxyribosyltransferase
LRIYLAAQYSQKQAVKIKAEELRLLGYNVTSTWIDEPENPNCSLKDVTDRKLREYAKRDLAEISRSDLLVLFTVDPDERTRRGGRHFESGFACGADVPYCIVGPKENIFHHLLPADLCFSNWEEFLSSVGSM